MRLKDKIMTNWKARMKLSELKDLMKEWDYEKNNIISLFPEKLQIISRIILLFEIFFVFLPRRKSTTQ